MKIDEFMGQYFFLSNFYLSTIEVDGKKYPSTEHYFQACKALDPEEHDKIRAAKTCGKSKNLGRKVKSFRKDWDSVRISVMERALEVKFQEPDLRKRLLDTGDAYLEEGNWWNDTFWGTCDGIGENNLGKLLMKLRERLKNEQLPA